MPPWITAILFAVLLTTVPMAWVLKIMGQLPKPLVASRRRWARWANTLLIGVATAAVTVFIRFAYYGGPREPVQTGFRFVIVAVIYVFAMVLLLRQFEGLYPEYLVTTGRTGLAVRKAAYRNIVVVETLRETRSETSLGVRMSSGQRVRIALPTAQLPLLNQAIERNKAE